MKNYIKPSVETVEFNTTDIIRTSGTLKNGGNNGDFTGNNASSAWQHPPQTQHSRLTFSANN